MVRLDRVDTFDRERWRRETRIHKQQTALSDAEALLVARATALSEREAERDDNRKEERAVHRRLEDYRQRRKSGVNMLETGRGDPEAAQRQIDKCVELIDAAETEMLERLEAADGLEQVVEAAKAQLAEATQAVEALRVSVPEVVATLKSEIEGLTGDRDGVFDGLPPEMKTRYAAFRAKGRWAVARIKGDSCDACRMKVPTQLFADLKRGLEVQCRGCKRWLVGTSDEA